MTNNLFEPVHEKSLLGIEELHAYAHPVRMAILAILAEVPLTLSMTARKMDVHPANLSRHFKVLERAGLIVLTEKRETSRNLEKYYRAAALSFTPGFDGLSPCGKRELALGALRDEISAAIQRVRKENLADSDMIVLMKTARLRAKDRAAFYRKLKALVNDFSSRDNENGAAYTMGLGLFPAFHFQADAKEIHISERKMK